MKKFITQAVPAVGFCFFMYALLSIPGLGKSHGVGMVIVLLVGVFALWFWWLNRQEAIANDIADSVQGGVNAVKHRIEHVGIAKLLEREINEKGDEISYVVGYHNDTGRTINNRVKVYVHLLDKDDYRFALAEHVLPSPIMRDERIRVPLKIKLDNPLPDKCTRTVGCIKLT